MDQATFQKFSLARQYELYLERMGLIEADMADIQRVETKRAFMGGCGQVLALITDELSALTEEDGCVALDAMCNEWADYFRAEFINDSLSGFEGIRK